MEPNIANMNRLLNKNDLIYRLITNAHKKHTFCTKLLNSCVNVKWNIRPFLSVRNRKAVSFFNLLYHESHEAITNIFEDTIRTKIKNDTSSLVITAFLVNFYPSFVFIFQSKLTCSLCFWQKEKEKMISRKSNTYRPSSK